MSRQEVVKCLGLTRGQEICVFDQLCVFCCDDNGKISKQSVRNYAKANGIDVDWTKLS